MGHKEIQAVLRDFPVPPQPTGIRPLDSGYINRSYAIKYNGRPAYVLQQLNTHVFPDIPGLMNNLEHALPLLHSEDYQGPELIPTKTGTSYLQSTSGKYWRLMTFVPDSCSHLFCTSEHMASQAGHILGVFHRLLEMADPHDFKEFLPEFQSLARRLEQFDNALASASSERKEKAASVINYTQSKRRQLLEKQNAQLAVRVCHNDTKMSNFLFSEQDAKALCLIDLDTIMPGYFYYDFGDALRTVVNPSPEDETDLHKITFDRNYCEAFVSGLSQSAPNLSEAEIKSLSYGAQEMPFLHGVRALTDFLQGDLHYRITYPTQNLDRSLALFQFASLAEKEMPFLEEVIASNFLK